MTAIFSRIGPVPWRRLLVRSALVGLIAVLLLSVNRTKAPGCEAFVPVPNMAIIAHAGGGLPERSYANNIEAMDLAYAHGLRVFEIDLRETFFGDIVLAHDWIERFDPRAVRIERALEWLRAHPDTQLVTDFKTDNLRGLARLAELAGAERTRIVPQIYQPSEYRGALALRMGLPIFTLYRNRDPEWMSFANSAKLTAVTLPEALAHRAPEIRPPVFVHTVNVPVRMDGVSGYYSDCLIPG